MTPSPIVFVVDDDVGSSRSVETLLESMGVACASFRSVEAFLEAYDPEQAGCLVTDLGILGINGFGVQQRLNELGLRVPVILTTANGDIPVAVRAMAQGAVAVLEKPCSHAQLGDAISKALALDARRRQGDAARRNLEGRFRDLSLPEREVLTMVLEGIPNKTIARRLDVSVRTVENRRHNIFEKLGVDSIAGLVRAVLLAEGKISG